MTKGTLDYAEITGAFPSSRLGVKISYQLIIMKVEVEPLHPESPFIQRLWLFCDLIVMKELKEANFGLHHLLFVDRQRNLLSAMRLSLMNQKIVIDLS